MVSKPKEKETEVNDFGFSIVNGDDVNEVLGLKTEIDRLEDRADYWKERAEQMLEMLAPFFDNLRKNPEKDYIYWPNRVTKIKEFEDKLRDVAHGNF